MIVVQTAIVKNVIPHPRSKKPVVIYEAKQEENIAYALQVNELHPAYTKVPVDDCLLIPGNEIQVSREEDRILGICGFACLFACKYNPSTHEGAGCYAYFKQ